MVVLLNDKNYNNLITEKNIQNPMIFVFYSDWYIHCKDLLKKIYIINNDKEKPCNFSIYIINEKNSKKILEKFSIRVYPTIIFFKQGKIYNFFIGNISLEELVRNFKAICPKKKKKFLFF